jgi:hypothetical protein
MDISPIRAGLFFARMLFLSHKSWRRRGRAPIRDGAGGVWVFSSRMRLSRSGDQARYVDSCAAVLTLRALLTADIGLPLPAGQQSATARLRDGLGVSR